MNTESALPVESKFASNFRAVLTALVGSPLSDGDLLVRYIAAREDEAFAELVRRLGPGVWTTCRRMLVEWADAEDAFQATFMVLARKAGSIRPPGKVAAWLHGVALLAARKARARNRRESTRLQFVPDPPEREAGATTSVDPALHEELDRLPERYRLPILLCELRELTAAQAARELGWPVGTVASRLSRGRTLLMERLQRRGITAAAIAVPMLAVPTPLLAETLALMATPAVAGTASVLSLTTEVLHAMTMTKLSLLTAGTIATVAFAVTVGVAATPMMPQTASQPSTKSASVDPLDRFKLENLMAVLKPEEIQKELGLSEEQQKSLDEARTTAQEQVQAAMRRPIAIAPAPGGPPGAAPAGRVIVGAAAGPNPAFAEAVAAFDKAALGILKPEQTRRLRQLTIQIQGPRALLDRRVIRALALTAEQEDAIDAELPAQSKTTTDQTAFAEELETVMKNVLKTLSAEQRKKWDTLIGSAMPASDLVKAHPQFANPLGFTATGGSFIIPARPGAPAPAPVPPKP